MSLIESRGFTVDEWVVLSHSTLHKISTAEIQQNMYSHLCDSKAMHHVLNGKQVNCLGSIQMLMKLCNHPSLVVQDESATSNRTSGRAGAKKSYVAEEDKTETAPGADGIAKYMPADAMGGGRNAPVLPELSGKMFVLYRLMKEMRKPGNGNDKIVIVSNYTQTLDLIGRMCRENSWGFCRLDGSISMKKRQKMVSCVDFFALRCNRNYDHSRPCQLLFSVTNSMTPRVVWLLSS